MAGKDTQKWEVSVTLRDICYDGLVRVQMSCCLFESDTGFLIAHNGEQMKVQFWGCFFSLVFIFLPSTSYPY